MNPRTCVGCRVKSTLAPGAPPDLVRLAWDTDAAAVAVDERRRAPGRGCWIHPRRSCADQALKKRAVHRGLRRRVDDRQLADLLDRLVASWSS